MGVETVSTVGLGIDGTSTRAVTGEITVKWNDLVEKADDVGGVSTVDGSTKESQSDDANILGANMAQTAAVLLTALMTALF